MTRPAMFPTDQVKHAQSDTLRTCEDEADKVVAHFIRLSSFRQLNMEIRTLPEKNRITFFEVQYFVNAGKQGTAKNVLLVTYSTERDRLRAKTDKSVQHRVRFDLSIDREIYRKAKRHLGIEAGEAIKQEIRRLKKEEKIITCFGIRQVHYAKPHRYSPGKAFHTRQLDPNNQVLVFIKPDNTFNAQFNWEGQSISVIVKPHEGELSENQSVGVGYYTSASADAELLEHLSAWKQQKSAAPKEESDELPASAIEAEEVRMDCEDADNSALDSETTERPISTQSQRPRSITPKRATKNQKQRVSLSDEAIFDEICRNSPFASSTDHHDTKIGTVIALPAWLSG
ncbi:hypothetical protein PQR02_28970 [Paraburkholderia sediminicola]|uniref:Uncharacterized protein n=1 Tax=Paraburkholderia rhynchosiae TaxID=487049 RepID=A0ACC7NME1_9BURK